MAGTSSCRGSAREVFAAERAAGAAMGRAEKVGCRWFPYGAAALVACVTAAGCGEAEPGRAASPPVLSIPGRHGVPIEPSLDAPELRLRLVAGSRFPILKTVRQTLVQGSADANQAAGLSELELLMSVSVEEVAADGRTRLRIRFERISYRQDAAGRRFEFDSSSSAAPDLPPEARVFAAMTRDGFAFWVGEDNRIVERVDFDAFLDRCLAGVPSKDRDQVASRIAAASGDESVANFVDDSIGLLPRRLNHGSTAALGDSWRRERRVVRPVRLFATETCTLARLDARTAEIDVNGTIAASKTFDPADESAAEVRVAGGHSIGHCRIDRATGLPLEARVERLVKLRVRPADGAEFDQVKRVETTIRAFPRQA